MATKEFGVKRDFRPATFVRKMKWEIGLFSLGIIGALMLPSMMRARQASRAGPQDATTAKLMARKQEEREAMMLAQGFSPEQVAQSSRKGYQM